MLFYIYQLQNSGDNKIIGAVTHVVIDNPLTGYGILITNMLEEGEKVLNYSNN